MSKEDLLSHFRNYDFESDERWLNYLKSVEIVGNNQSFQIQRLKGKWYKKNINEAFETEWIANATASAPTPPRPTYTSNTSTSSGPSATRAPPPQPPRQAYGAANNVPDRITQSTLFAGHVMIILLALVFLQPIARSLSVTAYRWLLPVIVMTQGYKTFSRYGLPRLLPIMPFNALWERTLPWLASVLPSSDFHWMIVPVAFLGQPPMALLILPPTVLALYHTVAHMSGKYGGQAWYRMLRIHELHSMLQRNQNAASLANAGAEIAVGFMLLMQLFGRTRSFILAFFYWNMLRSRYHAADCAVYHRQVWSIIDERTRAIRTAVPFVEMPLGYFQRWFLNPR